MQIPKPNQSTKGEIVDPYIKIAISGAPADKKEHKTKVVDDNGFNPVWEQDFSFELSHPDLAVLTFMVYDSDKVSKDDFLGHGGFSLSLARKGIRWVPLKNVHHQRIARSGLFIKLDWE